MNKESFDQLTLELMTHKYRYYILCRPTISDYEYDMLEKKWAEAGHALGALEEGATSPCIDFDENHPLAKRAIAASNKRN